jgi:hypothetical protein
VDTWLYQYLIKEQQLTRELNRNADTCQTYKRYLQTLGLLTEAELADVTANIATTDNVTPSSASAPPPILSLDVVERCMAWLHIARDQRHKLSLIASIYRVAPPPNVNVRVEMTYVAIYAELNRYLASIIDGGCGVSQHERAIVSTLSRPCSQMPPPLPRCGGKREPLFCFFWVFVHSQSRLGHAQGNSE